MNSDPRPFLPNDQTHPIAVSWPLVKALFEAALERQGSDREQFLDSECGTNTELRREVEALLSDYDETTGGFLATPIASIRSLVETEFPTLHPTTDEPANTDRQTDSLIGTRIGAYRIEQEIGRGGMGAVYLATRADSEFDKRVAIKLIRDGSESQPAIRRFRHERQILARLENAYIARLIDGGTTDNGLPYFVMEYVEGQTVLQYCETSSLTTRDRLNLFLKVCSAVQYAHERNIIHRDLKPGNIMVKQDGTPKLLDFGIAKIMGADAGGSEQDATVQGFRMLTPAYASPEQMRGDPATVQSDVYSLGIILYELLCGRRPDNATFYRSSTSNAQATHEAHLSTHLRAVALQSIHLDPAERYASIESFTADIRRYLSGAPPLASSAETVEPRDADSAISLAILPFRILGDQSSDQAFLASGITEALITKLSRVSRLSIPPPSSIRKYADGVEAVRAARELHVRYILEGSIHKLGESVRASVQLVFAEAGIAVWAAQVDASERDLLTLEDSIAEQVANAVVPHLSGEERAEISKSGTASGPAHAAYLRGRWHWSVSAGDNSKLSQALLCFMQAIAIDPDFARAHAGVADYYLRLGLWGGLPPSESFAASIASAQRAVELEPTLGEAHASLAFATWAYHRDEETAERHFNLATVRNPNYASAHHWFGLLNSARNRPELAIANLERAQKVDPNSPIIAAALGFVYYNARKFETALQLLKDASRELPRFGVLQEMLTWCYLQTGTAALALEAGLRAVELSNRNSASLSALAHAEAAAGNLAGATALRDEMELLASKQYVSAYDRASAALALGQKHQALQFLEQAWADRDWWVCWIGVDPRWDRLRSEPRFQKLLPQSPAKKRSFRGWIAAAIFVLVAAASFLAWRSTRQTYAPFSNLRFTKLTSNGTADSAIISPDGKAIVYAAKDGGGMGIWRRQMDSGKVTQLVSRVNAKITDLSFTSPAGMVQFVTFPLKDPSNRDLFTVPLAGGLPAHIRGEFPGPVSLSPDGKQAAFYTSNSSRNQDEFWLLELASGKRRLLAAYKYPQRFAWTCRPVWSFDGKLIAFAAEDNDKDGFLVRLYAIEAQTGNRHLIASPRWQWVQGVSWTGSASALAVVGQEHESSYQQIWYVPYPGSEEGTRRLGNDLDDYFGASLTTRSSELVSVQSQTLSNIYLAKPGDISHPVQITAGSGRYFDLCWMADGQILYASDATGSADLWVMKSDGTGQHSLISESGRNYAPIASPDAKSIAFHSNRKGNWQIWRADADGTNSKELSPNPGDGNWPQFSADGKSILFHRTGPKGIFNLWRVPALGGQAVPITQALTMHPAVSRTGGRIAAWYSPTIDAPHWKIAIFGPEGGEPLQIFNPTPDARPDTALRWTPQGDAISFLDHANSASNIWLQPLDGKPARRLTSFDSGEIYSFDWSRDGKLVYSRGLTTADVVLIRDLNASKGRR